MPDEDKPLDGAESDDPSLRLEDGTEPEAAPLDGAELNDPSLDGLEDGAPLEGGLLLPGLDDGSLKAELGFF